MRTGHWLRNVIISGEARKLKYRLQENKPFYHIFAVVASTRHDNFFANMHSVFEQKLLSSP